MILKPSGVVEFRDWHVYALCQQMRADEIEQYEAVVGPFDPEIAARGFINTSGIRFTLVDEVGNPIMCGGYFEINKEVWQSWMVGTMDGWEKNWRSITKASKWLIDALFQSGARRVQTMALAKRTKTRQWYEKSLKLVLEGEHPYFGKDGEAMVTYGLTRERYYGSI